MAKPETVAAQVSAATLVLVLLLGFSFTSLTTFPAVYTMGKGLTNSSTSVQAVANNSGFDDFVLSSQLIRFQTSLYASVCVDLAATIYLMIVQILLYFLKDSSLADADIENTGKMKWFVYAVPPVVACALVLFIWVLYEVANLYRQFFFNQSISAWLLLIPGIMLPCGLLLVYLMYVHTTSIAKARGPETEIRYRAPPSQKLRSLGMVTGSLSVKDLVQRIRLMEGWDAPSYLQVRRLSGNFEQMPEGDDKNELGMAVSLAQGDSKLSQYSSEAVLKVELFYSGNIERPLEDGSAPQSHTLLLFLS